MSKNCDSCGQKMPEFNRATYAQTAELFNSIEFDPTKFEFEETGDEDFPVQAWFKADATGDDDSPFILKMIYSGDWIVTEDDGS